MTTCILEHGYHVSKRFILALVFNSLRESVGRVKGDVESYLNRKEGEEA